jgi:membrane-associated HD superfamily phosphohydrolase
MNKYYAFIPLALLLGFIFVYRSAVEQMDAKDAQLKKQVAAAKAADDARRNEIERKAQEDALKHQQEREAEDRAREEKKEHDYQSAMNQLKTEADAYSAEADKFSKENAALELELSQARTLKEKTSSDVFELSKQVELAKIDRNNAELEIQRLIEMVAMRATNSSLTALPPAPVPLK